MQSSVEIWKPTFVNPDYLISNFGRVKTLDRKIWCRWNNSYSVRKGRVLKPNNQNSKHYWRITIPSVTGNKASRKFYSIHRLVATAFIPNPDNLPQINHIDGNKSNNCVSNLEWCDQGHNIKHAHDIGLISNTKQSANCHLRKLSEKQVAYIKAEFSKTIFTKRGDKMRFCDKMKQKFNLKSRNTIFWIIQNGTNKYIDYQ